MEAEDQKLICKVLTKACMWGQGGIQSVVLDGLEKAFPMDRRWHDVSAEGAKAARYEAVGVIKDEEELKSWLRRGYHLTNYSPGELMLFNPPPMNGLAMYVLGDLADKYGRTHDAWNFGVYENRAAEASPK